MNTRPHLESLLDLPWRVVGLMMMVVAFWATPVLAQNSDAYDKFLVGKYCEARDSWLNDWKLNDSTAAFGMGELYSRGLCVKEDQVLAARWYLRSALAGSARARSELGIRYAFGKGVNQNYFKAFVWLRVAKLTASPWEKGLADSAQRNLETISRYLSAQDMKTADAMADAFSRTYKLPSSFDSLD